MNESSSSVHNSALWRASVMQKETAVFRVSHKAEFNNKYFESSSLQMSRLFHIQPFLIPNIMKQEKERMN